ncbi:hypothetical protein CBL_05382 [Carabus blaptoides fortunei]
MAEAIPNLAVAIQLLHINAEASGGQGSPSTIETTIREDIGSIRSICYRCVHAYPIIITIRPYLCKVSVPTNRIVECESKSVCPSEIPPQYENLTEKAIIITTGTCQDKQGTVVMGMEETLVSIRQQSNDLSRAPTKLTRDENIDRCTNLEQTGPYLHTGSGGDCRFEDLPTTAAFCSSGGH